MKVAESTEIKRLKHREVERVRHHKLQLLINNLAQRVPDDNGLQNTQCAILKKTQDYIEFLINEYERIASIIEVDGYSSSQGTLTSSQGPLTIDDTYLPEQIICDINPEPEPELESELEPEPDEDYEIETKFPPLPSSLLAPDSDYIDFTPPMSMPINYTYHHQWNTYETYYPSPPSTSTSPPPLFSQPVTPTSQYFGIQQFEHKNLLTNQTKLQTNHHLYAHCRSCVCYSSPNFNNKINGNIKPFHPRDHLLTESIQDPYNVEPSLPLWA